MTNIKVADASWGVDSDRERIKAVRFTVFCDEQRVPREIELDEHDETSRHALVVENGEPIGTGRLLPDGHIGRMAVLSRHRGRGIGGAILAHLIDRARADGMGELVLSSQTHAIPFYARYGFEAEGEEYMEAGIPHRVMRMRL